MIIKKCVLLLKSQKGDGSGDIYEHLLVSNGFQVRQVKTLVFDYKHLNILKEKLINSDDYSGIFLSSPRCVHAVYLAINSDEKIISNWKLKHNFVVGEATYKDALEKIGLECKGKESGNALNLSKVILKEKSMFKKPFLFPHGNLKTDTLKLELGKEGVYLEEVLVYDTIANPNIEEEITDVTENFKDLPEYIVFFSPSGLHSVIDYLRKVNVNLDDIKFIAIGPVTELAMKEENLKIFGVTKQPTPRDLVDLILA